MAARGDPISPLEPAHEVLLALDIGHPRLSVTVLEQPAMLLSPMSASLIGHLGSSAFRLSATAVSMSLAGSCFSSESAPGPFHHGIRRRGGTIF